MSCVRVGVILACFEQNSDLIYYILKVSLQFKVNYTLCFVLRFQRLTYYFKLMDERKKALKHKKKRSQSIIRNI